MKTTEFGESGTVSGNYGFNERFNKWQVNIDCVEWMLTDDSFRFDTKEEMEKFVNEKYNVNFKF